MKQKFEPGQISKVIDQALVYQCACPAQVCRAIFELRELHEYQMGCANNTAKDVKVNQAIARAAEQAHTLMEDCLSEILRIEGWNPDTLEMPEALRKKSGKVL